MSVHPDPELLALAALPAEPADPEVAAHLHGCARCRTEVADLRRTVELARDGVRGALPAPPAHVWRAVAAELGLAGTPPEAAVPPATPPRGAAAATNGQVVGRTPHDPAGNRGVGPAPERAAAAGGAHPDGHLDPPPAGRPPVRPGGHPDPRPGARPPARPEGRSAPARRGGRLRRVALPVVAALVGLVVGLGIGRALIPQPDPPAEAVAQLAPVGDLDPAATGSVAMAAADDGERRMVVQVRGVTNTAGGDHLEAWLMDASGTRLVPLGPLDGGGGDFHGTFALPDGLPLGEFGRVDVSVERWDGNPAHSTVSVLRGAL